MSLPKLRVANGQFERDGRRFVPFGPIYFARQPGTCGGAFFDDAWWDLARQHLPRDFARMAEIGCNLVVPFIKTTAFWEKGQPVERLFERFDWLVQQADANGLYVLCLPNQPLSGFESVMGRPLADDPQHPHKHTSTNPQVFDWMLKHGLTFAKRYAGAGAYIASIASAGGRLWTGYAGYGPGEPEGKDLLPVRPTWQAWLRERYHDRFDEFLRTHPKLPEKPRRWEDVLLPVEVAGQFTEHDSRTFDWLAFTAELSARAVSRYAEVVHAELPGSIVFSGAEGCEFERGAMESLVPGLVPADALWLEMYQFNMTRGSHTHPDWERASFHEPIANKHSIDMLTSITEAWERTRWLKASAPEQALVCCHGTVMDNQIRWTPEPRDQRIIFERLHRCYMDAGADALSFWAWTDDESSSRPEPEFLYREGETMGIIDMQLGYRPVARRIAAYTRGAAPTARVTRDVLLLTPTAHMMGLDRIDGLTTVAAVVSAFARLGVAPEVKSTFFRGQQGIPLEQLTPHKLVVVAADEYRKDFPAVPETLVRYAEAGGTVMLAMGQADKLLSPTLEDLPSAAMAKLTGSPKVLCTNHQHTTTWFKSVRWRLAESFLPYWDVRRGRWMPGKAEKRLTFKFIELPAGATLLAEAAVPHPSLNEVAYGSEVFASAGEDRFFPLYYRRALGKGQVFVMPYSLNVFRGWLDQMDVQRDDWDWMLQAAIDAAGVTTDPCHSLSVLAQEFFNFRPTR